MLFGKVVTILAASSVISAAAVKDSVKLRLFRRDQLVLTDSVWTSTRNGQAIQVTPTVIDGVTISASPVTSTATPWVSLDSSGIPYAVTPTVSGESTISASPTPSQNNYPDSIGVPPVLRCFGDRVPAEDSSTPGYPFCTAANGTEMVVGETYWITWDPTYWGSTDITRIKLSLISYPIRDDEPPIFTTEYVSNNNGYYPLEVLSNYRRSGTAGYVYLQITPLASPGTTATHVGSKTGPLLRIINSRSDAHTTITRVPSDNGIDTTARSTSGGSSNAKVIAPAVVVPVIVVLAIAFGVIYFLRTRKPNAEGGILNTIGGAIRLKRQSGYGQGSKAQRTGTTIETANAVESENEGDSQSFETHNDNLTVLTEATENPFRG